MHRAPKKILVIVDSLNRAFEGALINKSADVLYVKTADAKEWFDNEDAFVIKKFGDRESGLSLTFIYKDGDKEFEPDNLAFEILKFKKSKLYASK